MYAASASTGEKDQLYKKHVDYVLKAAVCEREALRQRKIKEERRGGKSQKSLTTTELTCRGINGLGLHGPTIWSFKSDDTQARNLVTQTSGSKSRVCERERSEKEKRERKRWCRQKHRDTERPWKANIQN